MEQLLAVDLGVKTGLALYRSDGRLIWFRSKNFGSAVRLRKAIPGILDVIDDLSFMVIEGGGPLLKIWEAEALHRNLSILHIMADTWRNVLMFPREQRNAGIAKSAAISYAVEVIEKLSDHRAKSLTNDAAEAILIGLWGIYKTGWITDVQAIIH